MNKNKINIAWLFFIPQLYVLFKFSNYTSYGYLIVFILAFPMYLMNKLFVKHIENSLKNGAKHFIKEIFAVSLLSLFVYLSIYKKFIDAISFEKAIMAFSRYVFVFVFTFMFTSYLSKISLIKNVNYNKHYMLFVYMAPSLIVFVLVWLAAYPAVMSPDSIYIWTAVVRNSYDGLHPILYMLSVKALTFIWKSPAIVILTQILLCSFAFGYVVYTLRKWGVHKHLCMAVSLVLPFLPINAILIAAFWKDIPYTIGLILVSVEMVRAIKETDYFSKKSNIMFFSAILFFTMAMRHNGPYVIAFAMITYIIILLTKKMKKQSIISAIIVASCLVAFVGSTFIAKKALGENYNNYDSSSSFYALPLQGILAVYHDVPDKISEDQYQKIEKYLYIEEMKLHLNEFGANERWRNFVRTRAIINIKAVKEEKLEFMSLYLEFLIQNPVIVLKSYFDQTAIIWSARDMSYISGLPWYISYAEGFEPVFKHSKFTWLDEEIDKFLNSNPKGIRGFFEHPASMMMLILLLAYVGIKKKGIKSIVFILPALFNSLGYMATIEGQCTRYTYVNYTIAIIYFIYIMLSDEHTEISVQTKQTAGNICTKFT